MKKILSSLRQLTNLAIPHGKCEWVLYACIALFYLSLAIYYIVNFECLKDTAIMGYDTFLFNRGNWPKVIFEFKHPLMWYLMLPLEIFKWIPFTSNYYWIILAVFSVALNAWTMLLVYKICRKLELSMFSSLVVVAFHVSLATTLILSFNFETFTISHFLLLLLTLYILSRDQDVFKDNILFFLVSSVTISNMAKVFFAFLVNTEGGKLLAKLKRCASAVWIFAIGVLFSCAVSIYKLGSFGGLIYYLKRSKWAAEMYIKHMDFHNFWDGFVCEPLALHRVGGTLFSDYPSNVSYTIEDVMFDTYPSFIVSVIICIVIVLVLWSTIVNRKSVITHLFLFNILYDFFICHICGYGADEPHIFSSHWMWTLPLVLATLLKKYDQYRKPALCLRGLIAAITLFFFTYNMLVMINPLP